MQKIKLILLVLIISNAALGQAHIDTSQKANTEKKSPVELKLNFPETLTIKSTPDKQEKSSFWEKNMPWIVALSIGILSALINILIANRLRNSNERSMLKQIENSKEISLVQFKSTIATKNRQEWINEVRHSLSELIENGALLHYEMLSDNKLSSEISKRYAKILYCKTKIWLLLNKSKPEQKQVLDELDAYSKATAELLDNKITTVQHIETENKLVEAARSLFEIHWKKIKELK